VPPGGQKQSTSNGNSGNANGNVKDLINEVAP
jgi:hypothetical protein